MDLDNIAEVFLSAFAAVAILRAPFAPLEPVRRRKSLLLEKSRRS